MDMSKRIIILVFLCFSKVLFSHTKVPSFFSENMVLQQKEEVVIWGEDLPNTSVVVVGSWGSEGAATTNEKGKWKLKIKTPEAGGPYQLTIQGSKKIRLNNVLIGEVWFCSGQSNMFMPLRGYTNEPINGSMDAILESGKRPIRLFHTTKNTHETPLQNVVGQWSISQPSTVPKFSAVAYFFAARMYDMLGVPIGIIHSSFGGSKIEAWLDETTVSQFDFIEVKEGEKAGRRIPTFLYNAMIHPFLGYTIKGMLWYQGESNRLEPKQYKEMFPAMITSWRNLWGQGDFPFYFVQLAPYKYRKKVNAGFIREAQLYTMQTVPNTGMAVTLDIGECNSVHPKEKKLIGDRLAYWALSKSYDISGIPYSGPLYKKMEKIEDDKIKLYFDFAKYGLTTFDKGLKGFEIAGEDKVFYPAEAVINRDKTISVWSNTIKNPVAVRYAFGNCITGTLFNTEGLPASSFRTDDW